MRYTFSILNFLPMAAITAMCLPTPFAHAERGSKANDKIEFNCTGVQKFTNMYSSEQDCEQKIPGVTEQYFKNHRSKSTQYLYQLSQKNEEDLCQFSSMSPRIDQNRCREAAGDLKKFFADRIQQSKQYCPNIMTYKQACTACADNSNQVGCPAANKKIADAEDGYHREMRKFREEKMQMIQKMKDAGISAATAFRDNRQRLEADSQTGNPSSPAAAELGFPRTEEALQLHGGETSAQLSQMISDISGTKSVSEGTFQSVDRIENPYVKENLRMAAAAQAAENDLQQEMASAEKDVASKKAYAKTIAKSNSSMSSLGENTKGGGTDLSGLGSAGGALGALGQNANGITSNPTDLASLDLGEGATAQYAKGQESAHENSLLKAPYRHGNDPYSKAEGGVLGNGQNDLKNKGPEVALSPQLVAELNAEGVAGGLNSTASSRATRDALREKLRAKLALSRSSSAAASADAAALGETAGASGSALPGSQAKAVTGQTSGDTLAGGLDAAGGSSASSFAMPGSETDEAVQGMLKDFETTMGVDAGARELASVQEQDGPDIGEEESPSLFFRTRDSLRRCQKRGCVTNGTPHPGA